jgi:hypothetical protein
MTKPVLIVPLKKTFSEAARKAAIEDRPPQTVAEEMANISNRDKGYQ